MRVYFTSDKRDSKPVRWDPPIQENLSRFLYDCTYIHGFNREPKPHNPKIVYCLRIQEAK